MRTLVIAMLMLVASLPTFAQGTSGVSFAGGLSTDGELTLATSYFHPILFRQCYVLGGFDLFNVGTHSGVTDDIYNLYFASVTQAFLGLRIGDHLFAHPKLTHNWYGKYRSFGWGFAAGLLLHPDRRLSFGVSIGYDHIRFDSSLDKYGPARITSLMAVVNFHLTN